MHLESEGAIQASPHDPCIILGDFPRYPPRQAVPRTRYTKSRNRTCLKRGAFFLPAIRATSSYT